MVTCSSSDLPFASDDIVGDTRIAGTIEAMPNALFEEFQQAVAAYESESDEAYAQ